MKPILKVRELIVEYAVREGILQVVSKASLDALEGQITALVGESGCGKTTLIDGIMGTLPPNGYVRGGQVFFKDIDLLRLSERERQKIRWEKIAMVFQAAQNSLNPVLRVADHFIETVEAHKRGLSKKEILEKASELLRKARLDPEVVLRSYPHELSGGMKQRVIIALSLILDPEFLILDEPTSALDIYTQSVIIDLLRAIHREKNLSMLLVTHDLSIVAELAHRAAVMYAGKIIEVTDVRSLFHDPKHPYTRGLIGAIPSLIEDLSHKKPIPGNPPSLLNPPPGCRFHPRCPYATDKCKKEEPPLVKVNGGLVACWLYE